MFKRSIHISLYDFVAWFLTDFVCTFPSIKKNEWTQNNELNFETRKMYYHSILEAHIRASKLHTHNTKIENITIITMSIYNSMFLFRFYLFTSSLLIRNPVRVLTNIVFQTYTHTHTNATLLSTEHWIYVLLFIYILSIQRLNLS